MRKVRSKIQMKFCKCGHERSQHYVYDEQPDVDYGCTCYKCKCIKYEEIN